jgi:D-sedoheptulose 7-phosphate isomerase
MGDTPHASRARRVLRAAASAHEATAVTCAAAIGAAADVLGRALAAGGRVLVFGNGGSAAAAQHFAAELVGRYEAGSGPGRRALPALALSADPSVVTALSNDLGYDRVFARQIEAHGRPGDVAVGITTGGRSANVLRALEAARAGGLKTIALTGVAGEAGRLADVHVAVPEERTPRVQEVHATVLHILCELIEEDVRNGRKDTTEGNETTKTRRTQRRARRELGEPPEPASTRTRTSS